MKGGILCVVVDGVVVEGVADGVAADVAALDNEIILAN